jgi:hypothetical protein
VSYLEWDISAQLFPSHWEFDSCAFGEWWWRDCISVSATAHVESSLQSILWSGSRLRLATEQAKLYATCSDEILSSNVMSAPLLGSHLSTPPSFRPGNVNLAIKLAVSLSPPQVESLGAGFCFEHLMSDSLPTLQSSIAAACLSAAVHHGGFGSGLLH